MIEGKRRAVVVGINKYKDGGIPELRGAENDAQGVFDRLKNPDIGNFEIADTHFLTGPEATCEKVRRAISDVFWKTSASDVALFYFSGHGFVDGYDDGYIAPYDFDTTEPFVCGANMSELKHVLSRSVNKTVILILDCCYSGIATVGEKSASDASAAYVAKIKDLAEGRIILASCTPNQKSRERKNKDEASYGGHFTYHLLQALDGDASDEQGFITLAKLQEYFGKQFQGKDDQTPRFLIEGSNLGDIRLALSTERYTSNINARIQRAQGYIGQMRFASLLLAAKEVFEVIKINSTHREALELKNTIADTLDQRKQQMLRWLVESANWGEPAVPKVYSDFNRVVDKLSFDGVALLPDRDSNLLILLSGAAESDMVDRDKFISRCLAFNSPGRSQAISDATSRPAD